MRGVFIYKGEKVQLIFRKGMILRLQHKSAERVGVGLTHACFSGRNTRTTLCHKLTLTLPEAPGHCGVWRARLMLR